MCERAARLVAGLRDEGGVAQLRQARRLAVMGSDGVDLMEEDEHVCAFERGSAQVVPGVRGQLPRARQPALERGRIALQRDHGSRGGDAVGIVQVQFGSSLAGHTVSLLLTKSAASSAGAVALVYISRPFTEPNGLSRPALERQGKTLLTPSARAGR